MSNNDFPTTCCMNINKSGGYIACDKPAKYWYIHNEDLCSYCDEHNYRCGIAITNFTNLVVE